MRVLVVCVCVFALVRRNENGARVSACVARVSACVARVSACVASADLCQRGLEKKTWRGYSCGCRSELSVPVVRDPGPASSWMGDPVSSRLQKRNSYITIACQLVPLILRSPPFISSLPPFKPKFFPCF